MNRKEKIKKYIKKMINGPLFIFIFTVPAVIFVLYVVTFAHPILYAMTFAVYYPVVFLLLKGFERKRALIIIFAILGCLILFRAFASYRVLNATDLTGCAVFQVKSGESIEEDFLIPRTDWRLNRLLDRTDIEAVLRLLIDVNLEDAHLYINGRDMGTLSSLLVKKSGGIFYSTFPVYDCIIKFPKEILRGSDKVTIRVTAKDGFGMAYSSGLHPFPPISHSRLIAHDGNIEDLSSRYYNRRFRFQNVIYLISNKYYTKEHYPLVFGAIL